MSVPTLALFMIAALLSPSPAPSSAAKVSDAEMGVTVIYRGVGVPTTKAVQHHCHTRNYPVVRCFDSLVEVKVDLAASSDQSRGTEAVTHQFSGPYAIAYRDIDFGGSTLTLYGAIADLGILGWNDVISSARSLNCGIPRFYSDINYSGAYMQIACDGSVPNMGNMNDMLSSVLNMAP